MSNALKNLKLYELVDLWDCAGDCEGELPVIRRHIADEISQRWGLFNSPVGGLVVEWKYCTEDSSPTMSTHHLVPEVLVAANQERAQDEAKKLRRV